MLFFFSLFFLLEKPEAISPQRESPVSLVNRMFSSTMWYGKEMLDVVQKKTSSVAGSPIRALAGSPIRALAMSVQTGS